MFVGAWHKEARQEDGQLRGWSLFRMRAPTVKVCLNSLLQGAIGSGDEITERFPSGGYARRITLGKRNVIAHSASQKKRA